MCFRHYRALLDHPLIAKSDKLVLNMLSSNSTPFKEVTSKEEMLLVAQLLILSEVGGIVLPVSTLVINSLQHLLHYEAVTKGEGGEDDLVMGGTGGPDSGRWLSICIWREGWKEVILSRR